jgi:hypothetical protein
VSRFRSLSGTSRCTAEAGNSVDIAQITATPAIARCRAPEGIMVVSRVQRMQCESFQDPVWGTCDQRARGSPGPADERVVPGHGSSSTTWHRTAAWLSVPCHPADSAAGDADAADALGSQSNPASRLRISPPLCSPRWQALIKVTS